MRSARILAALLDLSVATACADLVGLAATAAVWRLLPEARGAVPAIWGAVAAAALAGFLLRDAAGGQARRWLGLRVVGADGGAPGWKGSLRRNLPLLVPGWNVREAWPVLRDGAAQRPADRRAGVRVTRDDG